MRQIVDTHLHTNYSDWQLSNEQIWGLLRWDELLVVATDHDIVNSDFSRISEKIWVPSCEWVEISVLDEKLGYLHFTAYARHFSKEIEAILVNTRNWRRAKLYAQIKVLQENGFLIDEDSFFNFFTDKWLNPFNLNIFHIASYIYMYEPNRILASKLTWQELDKIGFLKQCLRNEGEFAHVWSAWVEEYTPSTEDIVKEVHDSSWIICVAHPNVSFGLSSFKNKILHCIELWVDWIEINTKTTPEHANILSSISLKDKLLTFWSDCHFSFKQELDHGRFMETCEYFNDSDIKYWINLFKERVGI